MDNFFLISIIFCFAKSSGSYSDLELMNYINKMNTTWRAGFNFPIPNSFNLTRHLAGVLPATENSNNAILLEKVSSGLYNDLPEEFDARKKWSNCPTIGEVRDQGCCGSCWAVSSASAISDRICIHSNGTKHIHLSSMHLGSCESSSNGCNGGFVENAYFYWKEEGIVSGGEWDTNWGCQPYIFEPNYYCHLEKRENVKMPNCLRKCQNSMFNISYENDLNKGKSIYKVTGEKDLMREIYDNGPVTITFNIFADFNVYKSGIYKHEIGESIGNHAVKLIGWGIENNTPFWIAINSWGTTYGENGYFKILRGVDECNIESRGGYAGLP